MPVIRFCGSCPDGAASLVGHFSHDLPTCQHDLSLVPVVNGLIGTVKETSGYCWPCMDPPPMSRRNHLCHVLVQMQSCIRPLDAGHKRSAGLDEICASPPA